MMVRTENRNLNEGYLACLASIISWGVAVKEYRFFYKKSVFAKPLSKRTPREISKWHKVGTLNFVWKDKQVHKSGPMKFRS